TRRFSSPLEPEVQCKAWAPVPTPPKQLPDCEFPWFRERSGLSCLFPVATASHQLAVLLASQEVALHLLPGAIHTMLKEAVNATTFRRYRAAPEESIASCRGWGYSSALVAYRAKRPL